MPCQARSGLLSSLLLLVTLSACSSPGVMQDGIRVNDPYERQNRRVHAFNKALDARLIGPVSDLGGTDDDNPPSSDGGIKPLDLVINVGSNLSLPGKVVNGLLQGRPMPAARNLSRFAINSTIGIAGLFDPAGQEFGLTETDTDFGETLAVWGVGEGAYLELPVLGPSTQRDAFGRIVDLVIDPLRLALDTPEWLVTVGLRAASKAGDRARFGDSIDGILQQSADSYAQTRLIYLMHRRHDVGEESAEIDPYAETGAGADAHVIDPYEE